MAVETTPTPPDLAAPRGPGVTMSEKGQDREPDVEANVGDNSLTLQPSAAPTQRSRRTVLSRLRTRDDIEPGPPPDGGVRAWTTACIAHLIIFNIWGTVNSYGVFQTYYVNTMRIGDNSTVSWVGTVQVFIIFGMGTVTGRGLDAGFFKPMIYLGSGIYVFSFMMLSLCTRYWQIFLAQAVGLGVGYGLVFVPSLALTSTYFLKKRSTALAVTVTGGATGSLIFPAIFEQLVPKVGFGWAVRTIAFVQLVGAVVSSVYLKPRLPPRKSGPIVEWAAFKEWPYVIYILFTYFQFWSVYVGFFYLGSYGRNVLGASSSTSINFIMVMNGVGVVARIVPGFIADRWVGPLNLMIPMVLGASITLFCWTTVDTLSLLWVWSVFYGITAAGLQALFPAVLTSLTADPKKAGVRAGMAFTVAGVAVLTGPPIAGALVQSMGGGYLGLQLFAGTSMLIAVGMLMWLRFVTAGLKWTKI